MKQANLSNPQFKYPRPTSRRDFLSLVWQSALGLSAILGLAGIIRYFSHIPNPVNETLFDLGPADQFTPDSISVIQQAQAVIIPTPNGFEALSLVCPHLGCEVKIQDGGFECPCHGSRFTLDGSLLKGPADLPLKKLRLDILNNGHMMLDISE
jgi:cytochrome b6-f complex iron-sulfur subunit